VAAMCGQQGRAVSYQPGLSALNDDVFSKCDP
jgi:hypothetical protein